MRTERASGVEAQALGLLRTSSLFGVAPERELRAIAARLRLLRFRTGETVIREGEPGDECYLIRAGEAAVVSRDAIGQEVTLALFGPGESFGEIALTSARPRSATVRAVGDLTVYVLSRAEFERLRSVCVAFAAHLRRRVDLLDVDSFLKKASPFARLPRETVRRLAGQLERQRADTGETIIREGDEGDRFYLVRSGRVEVLKGEARLAVLEAGDCFGEVALLANERRTATVRALESTELLALARPEFDAVVREHQTLRHQLGELTRIRYRAAPGQPLALPDPITTLMPGLEAGRRQRYWLLLLVGIAAFAGLSALAVLRGDPGLRYAALAVGAFVGPVVYVTYLAESNVLADRPLPLALTFVLGAAIGLPVAVGLERWTGVRPGPLVLALLVGLIEEPAKLLGVLWLFRRPSYRFQMDGVIYGAAAGMGFAAFENLMYGLARFDAVGPLLLTLWVRTLLAPFGHGTWTAIVCAGLWGAKGAGAPRWDGRVAAALGAAVALHGLWNWQPLPAALNLFWMLAVGVAGLVVLRAAVQRAASEELGAVLALNPEVAEAHPDLPRARCRACRQAAPPGAHYCPRCGAALKVRSPKSEVSSRG